MNNIRSYRDILPSLGARVYIDPDASVIGDVELGDDVSVWPQTVIRGDVNFIRIGARSNIQDGTVIHVSHDGPHAKLGGFATVIGEDVTIGHKAIIHACRIEDAVLVGMGARSEEHTSELQSLMRISYAVFCLKKKTKSTHRTKTQNLI